MHCSGVGMGGGGGGGSLPPHTHSSSRGPHPLLQWRRNGKRGPGDEALRVEPLTPYPKLKVQSCCCFFCAGNKFRVLKKTTTSMEPPPPPIKKIK